MPEYFFVAGAQRSGTTYLYCLLDNHPEIEMARPLRPEPKFFMDDSQFEQGAPFYERRFSAAKPGAGLRGGKSASYIESEKAAQRIAQWFPQAPIIFVLRDPIERAISNYAILIIIGLGLALVKRRIKPLLLARYAILFLVVLSLHPLHWAWWLFPIWPVLALLTAFALDSILKMFYEISKLNDRAKRSLGFAAIVLFPVQPIYEVILLDIRHTNPSTRILTREWIIDNLPANSLIAQENYTAPLSGTTFEVSQYPSLASNNYSLDDYYEKGIYYLVASSNIYNRYLAEPERYPDEVAFHQTSFKEAYLLQAFAPSPIQDGPMIRIYEIEKP